ncbi:hypothetical protein INS49_015444 [Diaporthe citri]|uniref:uncharacterized protein n=1 Tax=Diaporthe citri TaxID=83186 RepID=UPI001C810C33|nr:uncharacterized protein INS49_015444 [Diaporthe citri]KAG6356059.1 hypothetical protein INS49_015444 [Diaporthe citri]
MSLRSFPIFGGSGRIGGAIVKALSAEAPNASLRLVATTPEQEEGLKAKWPKFSTFIANSYDLPSLDEAVKDVEANFVVR